MEEAKTPEGAAGARAPQAFQAPALDNLAGAGATGGDVRPNIDVILDVPVTLSLEVGRAQMSVGKLLRLSQGSVVELDRNAGEPLDVLVNGALVAHGEIVIVNDKFGIRLTDVVPPAKRAPAQG
ncbi:MAG: flagellar motor switch protein FliN [Gammaproteobacteria bacterium]|jgi:flagellar motor switch protein FliN/FliY|nr:flagellar motor switch protein FliN [Gammaproteobacteria bacterium]